MLLSAVPKRLLMRRSRSLSPCRALHLEPGDSSARKPETAVRSNPVILASCKLTVEMKREPACSSSGQRHAQYLQLASRWRTSLEGRRSLWASLVTTGHTGSYGEEKGGQNTGSGAWRGVASAGVLSTAALAFCYNRDNHNSTDEALLDAARSNNVEELKRLLADGNDPNTRHPLGWTALMVASINRQHKKRKMLV